MRDPTERFTDRVENYESYRPSYPLAIVETLSSEGRLSPGDIVADIGSGTGKLSAIFLRHGNRVIGVEPNDEMREAGRRLLGANPGFRSVAGRAEATGLDDRSVHLVAAGQAFHWFDAAAARREFDRILVPGGRVLLVWNDRQPEGSSFMQRYEELLGRYGTDYREIHEKKTIRRDLVSFFGKRGYRTYEFGNEQVLDRRAFEGRLLSSSYTPAAGHPAHEPMMREARRLFSEHEEGGKVRLVYVTRAYLSAP